MKSITVVKISFIIFAHVFCNNIYAQIEKGNWMIGGNGFISVAKVYNENILIRKFFDVRINNNTGYFFKDKFAAGVRSYFSYSKITGYEPYQNSSSEKPFYGLGVYMRYYMLPLDKRINLLTELYYQTYFYGRKDISSKVADGLGITVGGVSFLNNVIGIEYTISYGPTPLVSSFAYRSNTFQTGIGLQIHLTKDK